jgi:hypothetical protein
LASDISSGAGSDQPVGSIIAEVLHGVIDRPSSRHYQLRKHRYAIAHRGDGCDKILTEPRP